MKTLLFASNNQHKANEIMAILGDGFSIMTLREAGIDIDIPEPHDTLQDNAREKALTIFRMTGKNCFAEDSGLEVEALNGAPGVKSARYAGTKANDNDNIDKLLADLKGFAETTERKARFRTVISLILEGKEYFFEGDCDGRILPERSGKEGFGYDPIFVPEGEKRSFGEMGMEEKKRWSHRRKAMDKMVAFLLSQPGADPQ
jgi:XTP/dITP diphosphohydrolase